MTPSPADLRQRAHLHRQRTHLISKSEALTRHTLRLWYKLQAARKAGEDTGQLNRLFRKAEQLSYRFGRALLAVNDELNEVGPEGA